jgi:hypothetical protein
MTSTVEKSTQGLLPDPFLLPTFVPTLSPVPQLWAAVIFGRAPLAMQSHWLTPALVEIFNTFLLITFATELIFTWKLVFHVHNKAGYSNKNSLKFRVENKVKQT